MFRQPFNNKKPLNGLQHIQQNLNQQHHLLKLIQTALNDQLAAHCIHITANKKTLTLFTDSSIWASKLLYQRQLILDVLSENFGEPVQTLKVKVIPKQSVRQRRQPKLPSNGIIKVLKESNNTEQTDSLSASMNKLIKTLQKKKLA